MNKFDTKVQHLKYQVLRDIAKHAYEGTLLRSFAEIPAAIVPGPEPTMRCCIYKERAIVAERIKLAAGGDLKKDNIVEVIDIACDECPVAGYEVTDSCRGCIAHRCEGVCRKNAITFDKNQKALIDKDVCVQCGKCAAVCPYGAIMNKKRPCERACKVKAIKMNSGKAAVIDDSKCIECGACVYMCPFGAIVDKSYILDAVELIKQSERGGCNLYAVVAPSIASQYSGQELGKVITALKKLSFHDVVEAALGADLTAYNEARELSEKGFLISSCCPSFVDFVNKNHPSLSDKVSKNMSPMAVTAKHIKSTDPAAKVIFIGPCISKKNEAKKDDVKDHVDCVITFEELQALIDSRGIDLEALEPSVLDNASYYGRIFARSGGLADAVKQALKEQKLDFDFKPIVCDGIEACKTSLLKASKNALPFNFIEGMACQGGCIGGAGCLTHGDRDKSEVDRYGHESMEKTITDSISVMEL